MGWHRVRSTDVPNVRRHRVGWMVGERSVGNVQTISGAGPGGATGSLARSVPVDNVHEGVPAGC